MKFFTLHTDKMILITDCDNPASTLLHFLPENIMHVKRDVSGGEIDLVLLFFIFYVLTLWKFLSVRRKQLLVYRDKSRSSSPLEALLGALTQVPTELGGCPIICMTNRENT